MLSLEIDFRPFLAGGERFVADLTASSDQILRSVAGAAVVKMAEVTAPGSWGVKGRSAFMLGEQTLKADAYSAVHPIPGAISPQPVESIIRGMRGRDGRVRKPAKRIVVSSSDFAQYLRTALPRVGYTAGGFKAAADALGRFLPGWMTDVPGPGSIVFTTGGDVVAIEIRNEVPWFATMDYAQGRAENVLKEYEAPLREYLERALVASQRTAGLL